MNQQFILSFKKSLFESFHFEENALELFRFQASANQIYRKYLEFLKIDPAKISSLNEIPFLPIEFFKSHTITSVQNQPAALFESSGTTGQTRSRHYVYDTSFYEKVAQHIFEQLYGSLAEFHVLALLPSYLERTGSSLVYMVEHFIRESHSSESGFFLHDQSELVSKIDTLVQQNKKVLLIGVTFALLDLAEHYGGRDWSQVIVMETGGMKGRREELLREEVHEILKQAFLLPKVHSEYGMTELLSQAYSFGNGVFQMPPTMRILIRDVNDPFSINTNQRSGGINIIDLANVDSCAFIETKDIGIVHPDNTFQVLGRFDNSDIRGCNLLVL
ncbi:acyl transferase [Cytophagaceae bacterium DM2B3-1]|uniref:Acyl transferase n=1 Tax=Xanthocytophaga flava TaxID=3048013 RepID=A0ABT7CK77_9BACT|nr:acyl transferase [Xanthocytophaga flavus]MDJ1467848.1 acyl transferase [Xanthocytophaga flavus]MDJ1493926.1 acyl transferase [Xanthocytophaga flavus]